MPDPFNVPLPVTIALEFPSARIVPIPVQLASPGHLHTRVVKATVMARDYLWNLFWVDMCLHPLGD